MGSCAARATRPARGLRACGRPRRLRTVYGKRVPVEAIYLEVLLYTLTVAIYRLFRYGARQITFRPSPSRLNITIEAADVRCMSPVTRFGASLTPISVS